MGNIRVLKVMGLVTAEIINLLRKSFELNPIINDDPHSLINQSAASILDIVETKQKKSSAMKATPTNTTDDEEKLLDEFHFLSKSKVS